MIKFRNILFLLMLMCVSFEAISQCKHTLSVNTFSALCNGDGTSTVTMNITVLFGSGNNSAVLSYNLGSGEVPTIVIEDDNGDVLNTTFVFNVPSCNNYTVTLTGWTNPSGSGSDCSTPPPVISNAILPVSFGYIEAKNHKDGVLITWNTLSETNNEKFIIEKAFEDNEFVSIGEVKGAQNSSKEVKYEFLDPEIDRGFQYYRIKQIDLDGRFSYSEIRSVNIKSKSNMSVFPNLTSEYITISADFHSDYSIFSAAGRLVKVIKADNLKNRIDISELDSGLYFIMSNDTRETVRFIKQ